MQKNTYYDFPIMLMKVFILLSFAQIGFLSAQSSSPIKPYTYTQLSQRVDDNKLLQHNDHPRKEHNTSSLKPHPISHSEDIEINLLSRLAEGPCYAVEAVGPVAFFGNGAYLEIVDFSEPNNPIKINRSLESGLIQDIDIIGDLIYLGSCGRFYVINKANLENPMIMDYIEGDIHGVAVQGDYAYLADYWHGLKIVDISDPYNLTLVGSYEISRPDEGSTHDLAVSENHAYIAHDSGLRIIDISDESEPNEVKSLNTGGAVYGVIVQDQIAYVAAGWEGLIVYDVSQPKNPSVITQYDIDDQDQATNVIIHGQQLYVTYGYEFGEWDGLRVFDIADPNQLTEVGKFDAREDAHDVSIIGNYLFLSIRYSGVQLLDISDTGNPVEVFHYDTGNVPERKLALKENYLFGYGGGGLRVIDVSIPSNPNEVCFLEMSTWINDITIDDTCAYLACGSNGLKIIDISDPESVGEIGCYCPLADAQHIAVHENNAYVANGEAGLQIIEIANPSDLKSVGDCDTPGKAQKVKISKDHAFVADGLGGLRVIDISNPSLPFERSSWNNGIDAVDIVIKETYAFVANVIDAEASLHVIDISDLNNIDEVNQFKWGTWTIQRMVLKGNLLFIADGSLVIIDISDPYNLMTVGSYKTWDVSLDVAVNDNNIFVTECNVGLYIFEYLGRRPEIPFLNNPPNNYSSSSTDIILNWNVPSDKDGDYLHFKVELSQDIGFTNHMSGSPFESSHDTSHFNPTPPVPEGAGVCSFTISENLLDDEYWWRVSAWDGTRYGSPSFPWKFTIDTEFPYTANHSPSKSANDVPCNTTIEVQIIDELSGVDTTSIVMTVDDNPVNVDLTESEEGGYHLIYRPLEDFSYHKTVNVTIDAKDMANNAMLTERYSFTTGGDKTSPQILHSPISPANNGQSFLISTTLTDNVGIDEALMFYRMGGDTDYQASFMTNTHDNEYQSSIHERFVTEQGLAYYISVKDSANNLTTFPSTDAINNPQVVRVYSTSLSWPVSTSEKKYQMMSVPIQLENPSLINVFEDDLETYDKKEWRLFMYIDEDYVEYNHSSVHDLNPGRGFWLITKESKPLDTGSGFSVSTGQNYEITLQPGWNQIGNPFAFPVAWADVIKTDSVENRLVGYETYGSEGYDYTCTRLIPWRGYFVRNRDTVATTIEIPPREASEDISKQTGTLLKRLHLQEDEWGVQITASCGSYRDKDNYIGCLNDASDAWDKYDFSEVPLFGKYIMLSFPHEDWEKYPGQYTGDFRPLNSDGQYWDFCIRTNITHGQVELKLSEVVNLPPDYNIYITDKTTRETMDFTSLNSYTFHSESNETLREFRILIGREDFISENQLDFSGLPSEFELMQNYPNPFNSETNIGYALPYAGWVTIAVYNIKGQKIDILVDALKSSGRHVVSWDGKNDKNVSVPSGVYIILMEIENFASVRKMLLTR